MVGDIIAVYGALLASVLAFVQLKQWRASERLFSIVYFGNVNHPSRSSVEVYLTNLSSHPIDIDFIGLGWGYRRWFAPWKLEMHEISGLREIRNNSRTRKGVSRTIMPGEKLEGYLERGDIAELKESMSFTNGLDGGFRLYIEHSLNNRPFIEKIGTPRS